MRWSDHTLLYRSVQTHMEIWLALNRDGAVAIAASVMKAMMPHVGDAVQAVKRKQFGQSWSVG